MKDNIMHEWIAASVKQDLKIAVTDREMQILNTVYVAKKTFEKTKPKHGEVINYLYFNEYWHTSKEAATQFGMTQAQVNKIKRLFLGMVNDQLEKKI